MPLQKKDNPPTLEEIRAAAVELQAEHPEASREELHAALCKRFLPGVPANAIPLGGGFAGILCPTPNPLDRLMLGIHLIGWLVKRDKNSDRRVAEDIARIVAEITVIH